VCRVLLTLALGDFPQERATLEALHIVKMAMAVVTHNVVEAAVCGVMPDSVTTVTS
jgi:hypothetical protein